MEAPREAAAAAAVSAAAVAAAVAAAAGEVEEEEETTASTSADADADEAATLSASAISGTARGAVLCKESDVRLLVRCECDGAERAERLRDEGEDEVDERDRAAAISVVAAAVDPARRVKDVEHAAEARDALAFIV